MVSTALSLILLLCASSPGRAAVDPPVLPPPVSGEELEARRQALAREVEEGLVIVDAGSPPEGGEVHRDFYYLTGIETPGTHLLLEVEKGAGRATLFLPEQNRRWERWNGPRPHPGEEAQTATGIERILPLDRYPGRLSSALARARVVLLDYRVVRLDEEPGPGLRRVEEIRRRHPNIARFQPYAPFVHRLRQVKSPHEIDLLRRAIAITGRGLRRAMEGIRPDMYEFEVEALIEGEFLARGSPRPGFDSIIGSGPNACVLHYMLNRRRMEPGEMVVMDVGARAGAYTADVTRTVPVGGRFSERQGEIYGVVLAAQKAAIAAVRPGASIADVGRAAREVINGADLGGAWMHGVSHHVGLEVHDVSPLKKLGPGMVITIEPGLYLVDENLGIRIEDMVLVTEGGCEVLTASIPKELEEIEAAMAALY